jgi:hypothetical protein
MILHNLTSQQQGKVLVLVLVFDKDLSIHYVLPLSQMRTLKAFYSTKAKRMES